MPFKPSHIEKFDGVHYTSVAAVVSQREQEVGNFKFLCRSISHVLLGYFYSTFGVRCIRSVAFILIVTYNRIQTTFTDDFLLYSEM